MHPDEVQIERALSALERIAIALEVVAGLGRPDDQDPDVSAVMYTNDEEELRKEIRREAYTERTGIDLPEGEEPPSHGPKEEDLP